MGVQKKKGQSKVDRKKFIRILSFLAILVVVPTLIIYGVFLNSAGPISGSNLQVSFTDLSSYGIHTEIGGREIASWEDLGTEEVSENVLNMKARLYGKVSAHFYTKTGSWQAYTNAKKETVNLVYATVQKCRWPTLAPDYTGFEGTNYIHIGNYSCYYDNYNLGEKSNLVQGFNGRVDMSAFIVDLNAADFSRSGIRVDSGSLTSTTRKITITNAYFTEIGKYTDYYTSDLDPVEMSISATYSKDTMLSGSDPKWQDVPPMGLYPQDYNPENVELGQPAIVQAPTIGNDYVVQNGFQLALRPGITVMTQDLNYIHSNYVLVDVQNDWFDKRVGFIPEKSSNIISETKKRVVGWHVYNYEISIDCEVEIDLESQISFTIDDKEAYNLEDVTLYFQDHYWQTQLGGESVQIPIMDKSLLDLWWEQNYLVVIIIAFVAVGGIILFLRFKFGQSGLSGRKSININIGNHKTQK